MVHNSKNRNKIILAATLSLTLILTLYFFINPASAHAEKIYEVLKGTTGPSKTIKDVWTAVITLVNYTGAAMLIFIAFANILRLDLNTYGIKKWLPSFVFAIIAANFSWIIIRAVVDLASVACDALINSPRGAGVDMAKNEFGIAKAFSFKLNGGQLVTGDGTLNWPGIGNALVLTLLELVGTVMVLILAFLFIIRQYFLYFIAAIGPLAFISAVLPFTKTVWNYWWQNLWKWAFMPVVSLFWLWLGSQWIEPMTSGDTNFSVMSIAFATVCFYMAITNPSKMGEGIMNAWKGVGKWGYKNAGGGYLAAKGKANWDATKLNAQNWVKDKTGLGKGLDHANQRLANAQEDQQAISNQAKGDYIKKRGHREVERQLTNMNRGTVDSARKGEFSKMAQLAIDLEEGAYQTQGRLGKYKKILDQRRANRFTNQVDDLMKGGYTVESFDATWSRYQKQRGTDVLTLPKGKYEEMSAADKQKFDFVQNYGNVLYQAQLASDKEGKKRNDALKKAVEDRQALDNVATESKKMGEIAQFLEEIRDLERKKQNGENVDENKLTKAKAALQAEGYEVKSLDDVEDGGKISNQIAERAQLAQANYKEKVEQIKQQVATRGSLAGNIQDMVKSDGAGGFDIIARDGLEKSRMGKFLNGEINSGAATALERFSTKQVAGSFLHGLENEADQEAFKSIFTGIASSDPDSVRKAAELVRGGVMKLGDRQDGTMVASSFIDAFEGHGNTLALREIAQSINENHRLTSGKQDARQIIDVDNLSDDQLAEELKLINSGQHSGLQEALETDLRVKGSNKEAQQRQRGHDYVSQAIADHRLIGGRGGANTTIR